MPEHFRALLVIIAMSLPVFWLGRKPVCEWAIGEADFVRRRNLWLFVTALSFLAHNFWIFAIVAALVLAVAGARDSQRLGLYIFLLFAVPPFSMQIPGFGVINYLIEVNHARLLSLAILLPAYLSLRRADQNVPYLRTAADWALLGYLLLQLLLQGMLDTATNTLRSGLYAFIDVFLPYYVASRSLRDLQSCRDALTSFVFAVLLMAPVAAFEYLKHWLLYSSLPSALGVPFGMGNYLSRGDSLRALASTGHSIILGYLMVIALALFVFVRRLISNPNFVRLGFVTLLAGLLTPVSRGPWVGAAAVLAVVLLTGPNKASRIGRFIAMALPLGAALLVSPFGDKIIDLIPFVGTVDDFNVTYRQRLFDASISVMKMNPLLGSFDYLSAPAMQEMIQGEGIIDMVNSYLAIGLSYGLVGLTLFSSVFLLAAWGVWRGVQHADPDDELAYLGRALLAALVGALVTIATVSSILIIPTVYWLLAGLCVGFANLTAHRQTVSPLPVDPWVAYSRPGRR